MPNVLVVEMDIADFFDNGEGSMPMRDLKEGESSLVLIENNLTLILNKTALSPVAVQGHGDGSIVIDIVLAQLGLEVLSGLDSVVEGHLREHVMALVRITNVVVQMVDDGSEGAVNSAGGPTLEVPDVVTEVGNLGVGVLEVSNADDPSVDAEVGDTVVHEDGHGREEHREVGQDGGHGDDTAVGVEDVLGLVGLIEGGDGLEVVDPVSVLRARKVDEEVQGPSESENKDERAEGVDGGLSKDRLVVVVVRLLSGVVELLLLLLLCESGEALVGAGGGEEDDVLGHGSSALVMLRVRHLPGLVGDQESRVEDPAEDSVDGLVVREGSMSAL